MLLLTWYVALWKWVEVVMIVRLEGWPTSIGISSTNQVNVLNTRVTNTENACEVSAFDYLLSSCAHYESAAIHLNA